MACNCFSYRGKINSIVWSLHQEKDINKHLIWIYFEHSILHDLNLGELGA